MNKTKCRRLILLRESRGLTQEALASKLDISESTISMMEIGKREGSIQTLTNIAKFFDTDLEFIEGRETKLDIIKEYLLTIRLDKNNKVPQDSIPSLVEHIESYIKSLKD